MSLTAVWDINGFGTNVCGSDTKMQSREVVWMFAMQAGFISYQNDRVENLHVAKQDCDDKQLIVPLAIQPSAA